MKISPFTAWRAAPGLESRVASPPYDVLDAAQARALAGDDPACFLRVTRPDLEFPDGTPPDAPECYARAAERWAGMCRAGILRRDPDPSLYLYRLERQGRAQTGLAALCSCAEYDAGIIRRHEHTRPRPEADRMRHIQSTGAQTGPVFLAYRDQPLIAGRIRSALRVPPDCDFTAADGVRHALWRLDQPGEWARAFENVPVAYIADGHHRASAACRISREHPETGPGFLAVLFPASELTIMAYHRLVRDLAGRTPGEFLEAARSAGFRVGPASNPEPEGPGQAGMFLDGRWWRLEWDWPPGKDPVARLDASVLQDRMLGPLLGIEDPRASERIAFVGGVQGAPELERRVRSGSAALAFTLHPVRMEDLMSVSDAGAVMPPKSTWFEPKLRDGLVVHSIRGAEPAPARVPRP